MSRRLLFAALFVTASARAQPLEPKDVPGPLQPWVGWALRGHEEARCPPVVRGDPVPECAWPSRLELEVTPRGAVFRLEAQRFAPGFVALPGSPRLWPLEVRLGGRPTPVVEREGVPSVETGTGVQLVAGSFTWDVAPAALQLPPGVALVRLTVNGAPVPAPELGPAGQLLFGRPTVTAENARLDIQVQRKLTDGVPLRIDTRIVLDVAGRAREELLARALPEGFEPLALDAPLPARLEPDGRLRVQVKPGHWVVTVSGRRAALTTSVTRAAPEGPWAPGDEIWVFQANPSLRLVVVEGLPAVDPSQTQLPPEWRALPAYAVRSGETMKLEVRRRGDADPEPDQIHLRRQLWLDFSGEGWTFSDALGGTLSRSWRLEMPAPLELGRVALGGTDQPITRLTPVSPPGVEVRQGKLALAADARLNGAARTLPSVGWDEDVASLRAMLHLPPGWRLLAAGGVDQVTGTWLKSWSLLELFLVLVVAIATARLYGRWVGALALVALVLSIPEVGAPQWLWVAVLVTEALVRVLPEGKLRTVMRGVRLAAFALLALALVQFAVDHLRAAMYPALTGSVAPENAYRIDMAEPEEASADQVSGTPAAREMRAEPVPGVLGGKAGAPPAAPTAKFAPTRRAAALSSPLAEVDRLAVVQTGPGVPSWQWTHIPLGWSGPVLRGQTLHLYLLSPGMARALAFLRVLLLAWLALKLFQSVTRILPPLRRGAASTALILAALLVPGLARAADEPSDARLDELRTRLLAPPRCAPSCAAVSRLFLEVDGDRLRLRLEVAAAATATLPLPGSATQWLPEQVVLDGHGPPPLRREQGRLVLAVSPGVHQVLLEGRLPQRESVQLSLGLVPGHAQARVAGWKVDGIHEDGRADDTLQLTRLTGKEGAAGADLRPGAVPPFVRVHRHLRFGLAWEVETTVARLSAPGSAAVLEVPLIAGEAVNTPEVRVVEGRVQVNLPPQAQSTGWHSTLEPRELVALTAPASGAWVEEWTLELGSMWHVVLSGIPPLYPSEPELFHRPTWEPWPGEAAQLRLSRPAGAGGQTLTVDRTSLSVTPGLRATDALLEVSIRTSRGMQHPVVLPPGAELLGAMVGGQAQPLRIENGRVMLPLAPGASQVLLHWREPRGLGTLFRPEAVNVGAPSVNADTDVHLPADRWVLLTGGPLVGPSVLFWSLLVVTLLVAAALGRVKLAPLGTAGWMLLGVGLTQVPVWAGAVVVACLLAFGWRAGKGASLRPDVAFNGMQIVLAGLAVISLMILFAAVRQGLLGAPDMQVQGNASTAVHLRWYQDRTSGELPRPWLLSVPLLVYRLAMLAWALWLVTALLRWLRWGASAATAGGLWRRMRMPRQAPKAPPTAPPA